MRTAAITEGSSCTSSVLVHKWEVRSFESLFLSLSPDAWTSRCRPAAPEVVARHRYGRPVDCWAVGVIMFILWVPISNYWSFYRAIQDADYYPNNCWLQFVADIYRSCGQSFDITVRVVSFVFCVSLPAYQVTLLSTMRRRRKTQISTIASFSVALLPVTLSSTLRIGMTFHLQVHIFTTRGQ